MLQLSESLILAVCGDVGGTAAVVPVLEYLSANKGYLIKILTYGPSISKLDKVKLDVIVLSESCNQTEIEKLWNAYKPTALICGTSVNFFEFEKVFIRLARREHIPSLSVLDFWSAYKRRFYATDVSACEFPDVVAVMDQCAYNGILAVGCSKSRIVITGQPAFDRILNIRERFSDENRQNIRNQFHLSQGELLIVFFSQPLRYLAQRKDGDFIDVGYDEIQVLNALKISLDEICQENNLKVSLVVKPHPRDRDSVSLLGSDRVRVVQSLGNDTHNLMMSADLVVGMTTIALIESCYLRCLTLSLQPGTLIDDPLPTNVNGLSMAVYSLQHFTDAISNILLNDNIRSSYRSRLDNFFISDGATERVSAELIKLINRKH